MPCKGCAGGCYQCVESGIKPGANAALAWDMSEIYGLADTSRLPAPTTSSLARTITMWPESQLYARLHIEDAERMQGLQPGHTALPSESSSSRSKKLELTPAQVLTERFRCVGNALHGEVMHL